MTVHAVFSVAEEAIKSGAALKAAPALASISADAGLDGILCDYEPSDDYSVGHATSYAAFLNATAAAVHSRGLEVGFDSAGWGILGTDKFFP